MMKRLFLLQLMFLAALAAIGCTGHPASGGELVQPTQINLGETMETDTIVLKIGGKTFTATLADNSSARALKEKLSQGDITIHMEDYARMEKVGPLGTSLPRNDKQTTTSAGDLILYQGNQFVIYYNPNTWSLTRLGKINDATRGELLEALGKGDVTVTLSLK